MLAGTVLAGAVTVPILAAEERVEHRATGAARRAPSRPCTRFASTSGSDAAAGTIRGPFRTVQRLVNALQPGWTGCLLGGTFSETVNFRRGGTGPPVVLRTAPGYRRAAVHGDLVQNPTAPYVTIADVIVDARGTSQ